MNTKYVVIWVYVLWTNPFSQKKNSYLFNTCKSMRLMSIVWTMNKIFGINRRKKFKFRMKQNQFKGIISNWIFVRISINSDSFFSIDYFFSSHGQFFLYQLMLAEVSMQRYDYHCKMVVYCKMFVIDFTVKENGNNAIISQIICLIKNTPF